MSLISNLILKVNALTTRLNSIETSAKTTEELPLQNNLNVDGLLRVFKNGVSNKITIRQIISAITISVNNELLSVGSISLVGNTLTVNSGSQWKIGGDNFTTTANSIFNIPFCVTGKTRIDILVANNLGQIIKITGTETLGIAIRPEIPFNTLLITQVNVTDNYAGNTNLPPIINPTQRIIHINSSQLIPANWDGALLVITGNITLTIGSNYPNGLVIDGVVDPSSSLSFAITSPKFWKFGSPSVIAEKSTFVLFQSFLNVNEIYLKY